jgi:putative transposase
VLEESYPSDMKDGEWEKIRGYLCPKIKRRGPKLQVDIRRIYDGIRYRQKTGCQYKMLPKVYGNPKTIWYYFNKWSKSGVFERMNRDFCMEYREHVGRNKEPSAAIIDSQSVKVAKKGIRLAILLTFEKLKIYQTYRSSIFVIFAFQK